MKRYYISADIEGTCGIVTWDETELGEKKYDYFARQMSREVAAACEGLIEAGAEDILVRDAHDSARNIDPSALPEQARIFRNWQKHPFCMMSGIDSSFAGAVFTGYHSAVGMDTNNLSHTMSTSLTGVFLNGEICPELMINCLTASYVGVPVLAVTGDKGLCDWISLKLPNVVTVPVNEGTGSGCISINPNLALKRIREGVKRAAQADPAGSLFPMPEHFELKVRYRDHSRAYGAAFYPGARKYDAYTVVYEADDWMDVLTFMHFAM